MRTAAILLPLLCLLAFLPGCTGVASPQLSVVEVRTDENEPTGRRLIVVVKAENRSDDALPLKDAAYTVRLDGKQVFQGQRSPESTLRKWGIQTITLPVAIAPETLASVGSGSVKYEVSGSLVYLPPGKLNEILYDYGLLRPTTGFHSSGQIDLAAPTPAAVPAPAGG